MQLHIKEPSWKVKLMDELIEKLYHPARCQLLAELDNMLVEHRNYRKIPATTSVHAHYEGAEYLLPADIPGLEEHCYIDLDPRFHTNMAELKEDHIELNQEREELKIFFRKLLNEVGSPADVEMILPKSFYMAPLSIPTTMSFKQTEKFRRENLSYITMITKRMVENLLMK